MWFEKKGTVVISLPGVPYEMKGIMQDFGFDALQNRFELPSPYRRTIQTWGVGESFLAQTIKNGKI
jgi:nicotinamide-nucleotide amidase